MKTVHSYQEIGTLIDQGKQVLFTCYPVVRVVCVQKNPDSDIITVTMQLSIRDTALGIMEYEYLSMLEVLEAFDIDDLSEIWEVLT